MIVSCVDVSLWYLFAVQVDVPLVVFFGKQEPLKGLKVNNIEY